MKKNFILLGLLLASLAFVGPLYADPGGRAFAPITTHVSLFPAELTASMPPQEGVTMTVFRVAAVALSIVIGMTLLGLLVANAFAPWLLQTTSDTIPDRYDKTAFGMNLMTGARPTMDKRTKSRLLKHQAS